MGLFDKMRGLKGGRLGIEIGHQVAAVEIKGDRGGIRRAGSTIHAGYSGSELGRWIKRWLDTLDTSARAARAVVVDGDVHHFLVSMPEMSDAERHLAAGAEIRKLAPVPVAQLAYSHMAVGTTSNDSGRQQKVLISAVDKGTLRNATAVVEAAGLTAEVVTTVPAALIQAHDLLPPLAGGTAIAYLAPGRSYLVVLQDGVVELVRDFALRVEGHEHDGDAVAELAAAELRRSFLYFGQRAQGATVNRLVLAGPMSGLAEISSHLRAALSIDVEPFDVSGQLDLGDEIDAGGQPALAVALGAAMLPSARTANLVSPEEITEARSRQAMSWGSVAAAVILALLIGWGLYALFDSSLQQSRIEDAQTRITALGNELQNARNTRQQRADHTARRVLLEQRAVESTLMGTLLQRIGQRVPDELVVESMIWQPLDGPDGGRYWDVRLQGLVLGASRSESQALFNRFHSLLAADPVVHRIDFVQPLVVGSERDRTSPLTSNPEPGARPTRFGVGQMRTTLDEVPVLGPTPHSVGFDIRIELKSIGSGGTQ